MPDSAKNKERKRSEDDQVRAGNGAPPPARTSSRGCDIETLFEQSNGSGEVSKALGNHGEDLIGVAELKFTSDDLTRARIAKGADPVVKTFDFHGDGSHYRPSFHLRLLKDK